MKPKIAISVGDLNGVGLEIILKAHKEISNTVEPIYCIRRTMLEQGANLLKVEIPQDMQIYFCGNVFEIIPGLATKFSGLSSYESFLNALNLCKKKTTKAMVTLPINKEAWNMANIPYKGHTQALSKLLKEDAIMMLGCDKLFTALYTDHIPLKDVFKNIKIKSLTKFLVKLFSILKEDNIGVLGLNPHNGENGILSYGEDEKIKKSIKKANTIIGKKIYNGPIVPDTAFAKKKYKYYVCMYHDQGLIPLKTLFFDESINVSLGLSIIRTSVDHGTAFNIAYKNKNPSISSFVNAVEYANKLISKQ